MDLTLVSFLGVIVGASLQYFFTKYLENQRHIRTLKTQAYTDYLKYLADSSYADDSSKKETLARITDSKARICLYGSKKVLTKLSNFHRLGARFDSVEQKQSFVEVVREMRIDSSKDKQVSLTDYSLILLKADN